MKNCIITQTKDQSNRFKDWILYHKEEGFDTIIYFDDYSEDNSVEVIKDISDEYDVNIIHVLKDFDSQYFNKMNVSDYDLLRMHHYRKPCMDRSFKFIEDRTILDKMIKIRNKYEGI